ncbi:reverse transcriptase domain, reverse transcriptase zinc-binding domain protein [Tanacetum coccineum]
MVMEILSLILKRRVRMSDSFRFHKHCEELEIINVCFADDLFIFACGDLASARVILESLDEFKMVSGLVPSIPKSTAYFCNVVHHVKLAILNIMPFSEGELPVKYLGVPLIYSRLLNKYCKILVEKAKNRIGDWKNKSLSFAGRLQLCKSVISSMHVYWASVLMIPKGIIYDIHQLIRGFLWWNGEYKQGKAKVAWDDICLPKEEGGLGLYISREGFSISTSVAELVTNRSWSWPQSWILKAPDLGLIPDPVLDLSRADVRQWRDNNGSFLVFSVAKAWETLRPRGTQVPWVWIVLFSHAIPRHAFHLWLVMRNGLKTQDRMRQWDVGVGTDLNLLRCALCDSQPDSHAHLFFECPFSSKVWLYVRELTGMELIPPIMHDITSYLQPISKKRTALSILGKLILAALSYFIWLERNNRVFKQVKKSPEDIHDIIMVTVRLKLLTFRFKDTSMVNQLLARWKMPKSFRLYG